MAKFNYTINYKDFSNFNEISHTVTASYDDFSTLIKETQKDIPGYVRKSGNLSYTPSEYEYNSSYDVARYNREYDIYQRRLAQYYIDEAKVRGILSDRRLVKGNGIMVLEDYDFSERGSYNYYSPMKIYTTLPGTKTLAKPISWGWNSDKNDKESGLYLNKRYTFTNVSRTTDGEQVDMTVTITNIGHTLPSDRGVWWYRGSNDSIGLSLYDIYRLDFRIDFSVNYRPVKLALTSAMTDIDAHQHVSMRFSDSDTIISNPPGSGISWSRGYLGNSTNYEEIEGESDIPRGSFAVSGIGSSIDVSILANKPGETRIAGSDDLSSSWVIEFFGNSTRGEIIDFSRPIPPTPVSPIYRNITIYYDKVAKLRPWAIRNSGQWVSFTTKQIDMIIRKRGKQDTSINAEDAGKPYGTTSTGVYLPPYSASGNAIRKDGTWKQQGKIGR